MEDKESDCIEFQIENYVFATVWHLCSGEDVVAISMINIVRDVPKVRCIYTTKIRHILPSFFLDYRSLLKYLLYGMAQICTYYFAAYRSI